MSLSRYRDFRKILAYPGSDHPQNFGLFLDHFAPNDKPGWSVSVTFVLTIVNHIDPKRSTTREAYHTFKEREKDWGFKSFAKRQHIKDPLDGFVKDGALTVDCSIEVHDDGDQRLKWANYDSKKETGYVGLKNQGATCYMNSLLQTMFHTNYFRRAIYQLPTDNEEKPEKSIPLALQRVFYLLQHNDQGVDTKQLTRSFGWDTTDSFMQHDIQELNRVLVDNLETKMKGTAVDGAINKLFEGKMVNYIKCINVNYESSRTESYYDISLNVKGMKDIYASFDAYVEPEVMDGENQYRAEGHGLQDAKKGIRFQKFPPVLHLQLKRFEYDFARDVNVKINDKFEFPTVLELDKYLSEDADRSDACTYDLHAVLVHSGDVGGGHYYSFIRPGDSQAWYKFDDDRVTKAREKDAVTENYGLKEQTGGRRMYRMSRAHTSAYMLVYFRRSDKHWTCARCDDEEIPGYLQEQFEEERIEEEERRKEKQEAHLYIKLKIALESHFKLHTGGDLTDFSQAPMFKVKKDSTLREFMKEAEEAFEVPVHQQRYWKWTKRQNKTHRPSKPVSPEDYDARIETLFKHPTDCKLLLDIGKDLPPDAKEDELWGFDGVDPRKITLFFKNFDPVSGRLTYVGKMAVGIEWKLDRVTPILNRLMGWPADKPLIVNEEIRPIMIEPVNPKITLESAELLNGDILVFQEVLPDSVLATCRCKTIREHYHYLVNRLTITFKPLSDPKAAGLPVELSRTTTYDGACAALGRLLDPPHDGARIRLTGYHTYSKAPRKYPHTRMSPLTRRENTMENLFQQQHRDMPVYHILFYELLEMPLVELESKMELEVHFYNSKVEQGDSTKVLVSKKATVGDLLEMVRPQLSLSEGGSGRLRMMEISYHRINKLFRHQDPVTIVNNWHTRVEEVPEEELTLAPGDRLFQCGHYTKEVSAYFGNPFYILWCKDEEFSVVKAKIQKRLEVEDEEFAEWKFGLVTYGSVKALTDGSVLSGLRIEQYTYIGMDHKDTTPPSKRRHQGARHYYTPEKSIKIYN